MRYVGSFIVVVAVTIMAASLALAGQNDDRVSPAGVYLSPTALAVTKDGKAIFVACATANKILRLDPLTGVLATVSMSGAPSGLVLSPDETELFVTCAAPESKICVVDLKRQKITATIAGGYAATAPVVSPDGRSLYVCNQFNNSVSVIDLTSLREIRRVPVLREPVAADITKDGKYLLVANQLPIGCADGTYVAAAVSVIDLATGRVIREIQLPHGSTSLKGIRISPDGKNAVVTHILARFYHPTTDVVRGWINANALTIIDIASLRIHGTILLDEPERAGANPWGVAWSGDGSKVLVTHAGTHEVSVINFPAITAELPAVSASYRSSDGEMTEKTTREQAEASNYGVPYLVRGREWIKLSDGDFGPRAVVVAGRKAYTANYFSDSLGVIDLDSGQDKADSIPLGPRLEMNFVRKGELNFHNGSLCYQGWQSCSSCHPGNARVDGLNWDYLNVEIGNPRNTRSLLFAHETGPVITRGVLANAGAAVRAAIKFILFTNQPEDVASSIDEYLKSLKPLPSPYLIHGKLSKNAEMGKELFSKADCINCHKPGLFTDLLPHDVGTQNQHDKATDKFYTPTLIEVWRTAPYLHDGSAATIRDVLITRNLEGEHGDVSGLSKEEIDDLCEYVLSL